MSPAGTSVFGPMWRNSSLMKLWQKRITSLSLLPLGSKSEPPLPPPMGSVVRAVLEDLLEGEELEDAEVDRGVEAQAALVGADGAVHLDAEAAVDLDLAAVVLPRDAEHEDPLRLDDALQDLGLPVLRMPVEDEGQGLGDLLNGLMKLRLRRVLGLHLRQQRRDVVSHVSPTGSSWTQVI